MFAFMDPNGKARGSTYGVKTAKDLLDMSNFITENRYVNQTLGQFAPLGHIATQIRHHGHRFGVAVTWGSSVPLWARLTSESPGVGTQSATLPRPRVGDNFVAYG